MMNFFLSGSFMNCNVLVISRLFKQKGGISKCWCTVRAASVQIKRSDQAMPQVNFLYVFHFAYSDWFDLNRSIKYFNAVLHSIFIFFSKKFRNLITMKVRTGHAIRLLSPESGPSVAGWQVSLGVMTNLAGSDQFYNGSPWPAPACIKARPVSLSSIFLWLRSSELYCADTRQTIRTSQTSYNVRILLIHLSFSIGKLLCFVLCSSQLRNRWK